jgi:hypothetical protein
MPKRFDLRILDKDTGRIIPSYYTLKLSDIKDNDSIIIEQFTGMYDKFGTPIYEGDIVKITDGCDVYLGEDGIHSDIGYCYGSFYITIRYDFTSISLMDLDTVYKKNGYNGPVEDDRKLADLQVVGNLRSDIDLIRD